MSNVKVTKIKREFNTLLVTTNKPCPKGFYTRMIKVSNDDKLVKTILLNPAVNMNNSNDNSKIRAVIDHD
ncbi:MAG: hypothetical protein COA78_22015 [Blastopirellula sp.]|nr:MAG: hypothetical protein COA78_22015 [Blastopirellula sp.]